MLLIFSLAAASSAMLMTKLLATRRKEIEHVDGAMQVHSAIFDYAARHWGVTDLWRCGEAVQHRFSASNVHM